MLLMLTLLASGCATAHMPDLAVGMTPAEVDRAVEANQYNLSDKQITKLLDEDVEPDGAVARTYVQPVHYYSVFNYAVRNEFLVVRFRGGRVAQIEKLWE